MVRSLTVKTDTGWVPIRSDAARDRGQHPADVPRKAGWAPKAELQGYISMALAVTFPFNVIAGIPLYLWAAQRVWSA
jgi:hypothetical protein